MHALVLRPSSFVLLPSSFILHPSSFILHPSSFILLTSHFPRAAIPAVNFGHARLRASAARDPVDPDGVAASSHG